MPELSSYEQQRLENIKRNEQLMRELDLLNGASGLGIDPETTRRARKEAAAAEAASPAARARKPKLTPAEIKARKEAAERRKKEREEARPTRVQPPRRSSARLAGVEADSEVLKRKYEEAAEAERNEREAAKKARHEDHDLSRLTGGGLSEADVIALRSAFTGLGAAGDDGEEVQERKMRNSSASPRKSRTQSKSGSSSIELTELKEELDKIELCAVNKVTLRRIYSMAFHPTTDKDLIFAGDKEGAIGIWEPWAQTDDTADDEDADEEGDASKASGRTWSVQVHGKDAVVCLKFDPADPSSLYSSSYDSTIRQLHLGGAGPAPKNVIHSTEVWAGTPDVLLSIFDVLAPQTHPDVFTHTPAPSLDERSIWIADHRGGLIHVDVRERQRSGGDVGTSSASSSSRTRRGLSTLSGGSATSRRWQVHEKKIGALSVNQAFPYAIATAGLDQHVRLFDVRALDSLPLTMEAPYNSTAVDAELIGTVRDGAQRASCRARLACTSVDWSPRGDQLAALSYDDVVKVWDVNGSDLRSGFDDDDDDNDNGGSAAPSATPSTPRGSRSRRSAVKKEEDSPKGLFQYYKREPKEDEVGSASPRKAKNTKRKLPSGSLVSRLETENILEKPAHTFPHNNQTGKWLTMFRVKWNQNPQLFPHFSLGSMHRHVEIWAGDGSGLLRSLYDEDWVTAVPAVTAMHPRRMGRLVAGNASGKCHLWCPPPTS
ncbi:hypothetical protein OC846_000970 [Tilletia horrida]|uniref:DNA damage-binding protein CMR1 n=1 Tax=Tilletia horrida TaxID=155126 RepID=A0AAN6GTM6_9BASI|nr:hypothetical protein OC846_000970 [Tilletia horrida]